MEHGWSLVRWYIWSLTTNLHAGPSHGARFRQGISGHDGKGLQGWRMWMTLWAVVCPKTYDMFQKIKNNILISIIYIHMFYIHYYIYYILYIYIYIYYIYIYYIYIIYIIYMQSIVHDMWFSSTLLAPWDPTADLSSHWNDIVTVKATGKNHRFDREKKQGIWNVGFS